MPTGPKEQKRPADVADKAVKIMRTAIGQEKETVEDCPFAAFGEWATTADEAAYADL